jgi:heme A synthase
VSPRLRGWLAWGLAVLALAAATGGTVSRAEPAGVVPLPGWVRSVESIDDAVVV